MGRILAIDFGKKRTGLAVTDSLRITANPLMTIETKQLPDWLRDYFAKEMVDEVVIGHPKQMNGEDSESMQYIRPFVERFKQTFPDTLSPKTLIHTEIIDKQRSKGYHIVGKGLLSQLAESIAHAQILLIYRNVNRIGIIQDHLQQLIVCVFCRS